MPSGGSNPLVTAEGASPSVISFDHGSLDTLDALGLGDHILAVPKQSLTAYLSDYAGDAYPYAGGLKSLDLGVIRKLQPAGADHRPPGGSA